MAAEGNRSERARARRRPSEEEVLSTSASVGYRDRIVLVTGGNSGIGRAFVERFVAEGASVVACGRNEATLQALKVAHPSVEARRCDVALISEVDALAEFVSRRYGRLDVLVNNAGVMEQVNMLAGDVDAAAITREIAINLTAPILLVRRCLPFHSSTGVARSSSWSPRATPCSPRGVFRPTRRPRLDCVPLPRRCVTS